MLAPQMVPRPHAVLPLLCCQPPARSDLPLSLVWRPWARCLQLSLASGPGSCFPQRPLPRTAPALTFPGPIKHGSLSFPHRRYRFSSPAAECQGTGKKNAPEQPKSVSQSRPDKPQARMSLGLSTLSTYSDSLSINSLVLQSTARE